MREYTLFITRLPISQFVLASWNKEGIVVKGKRKVCA